MTVLMQYLGAADEKTVLWTDPHVGPRQIACLACGETRVVIGPQSGECPRCHYVGWTYAEELDASTVSRQIKISII
jgi:hypothetical protein